MAFFISDKTLQDRLNRHVSEQRSKEVDSLSKLASGSVFTEGDPRPAERALAEKMEFRVRSLAAAKRNANDAVSLLQTAESSLSEINNLIVRMKEINVSAASTTIGDQERRYLMIEYEALHDEINRIAEVTEYNGIPVLNGESPDAPEELVFRVDDPYLSDSSADEDINAIRFEGFQSISATTEALGIKSARELLGDSNDVEGISLRDVEDLIIPEDDEFFSTTYDQAISLLSTQRSVFGAMQARLDHSLNYIDVYQENISAAKSKISDTDYAVEVANLTAAKVALSASSSLLAQSNIQAGLTLKLIDSVT